MGGPVFVMRPREPGSPQSHHSNRGSPDSGSSQKSTATHDSLLKMGYHSQDIEAAEKANCKSVEEAIDHIHKSQKAEEDAAYASERRRGSPHSRQSRSPSRTRHDLHEVEI